MIGRRGFLKCIGAAVLGLSLALKAPEIEPVYGEDLSPQHLIDEVWEVSRDGGQTWQQCHYGDDLTKDDIVRFPLSQFEPRNRHARIVQHG